MPTYTLSESDIGISYEMKIQVSFVYVIVTSHINWHREIYSWTWKKLGKHREFENGI